MDKVSKVKLVTDAIQYKDWRLRVEIDNQNENGRVFIQWIYDDKCVLTNKIKEWHGRKYYLSEYMTDDEIVKTAFTAAIAAEEHEVREKFSYKGIRLFNPHVDIEALMLIADSTIGRK